MNIDIVDLLKTTTEGSPFYLTARASIKEIERLRSAGRNVVDARYYNGDDGWDKLKNAIAEMEGLVGRS